MPKKLTNAINQNQDKNDIFEEKGNHHQHQTKIASKTQSRKREKYEMVK